MHYVMLLATAASVNFKNISILVWILKPIGNAIFHKMKLLNAYT
jgi:hypothetical protein